MPETLQQIQAKILLDYVEDIRKEIIREQDVAQPALVATGRLQSTLSVKVGVHSDRAFLSSQGNYLDTTYDKVGTPPHQVFPFKELLENWIPFKPRFRFQDGTFMSDRDAAYFVARKIWNEGSAVFRGTRKGIPIFEILKRNLPTTGRKLAQAYGRDFAANVKTKLES